MHGLIFETSVCYWQNQPGCYLESLDTGCEAGIEKRRLVTPLGHKDRMELTKGAFTR